MNVNSRKRIRRTPDEARRLILETAATRLAQHGIEGLNIGGVAKDAGISHATIIHHFGSTEAMREALARYMTQQLLTDVIESLRADRPSDEILGGLFKTLSDSGHGRLIAWLAVGSHRLTPSEEAGHLLRSIIDALAANSSNESDARFQVLLVATAALGLGIGGDAISTLMGLTDEEKTRFPGWLAEQLEDLS